MAYGTLKSGRIPNSAQESHPWRIREIVPDFTLEDVWALPVEGGAEDFSRLLEMGASIDPARSDSRATRALWQLRDRLGAWFNLGRIVVPVRQSFGTDSDRNDSRTPGELPVPGTSETSLAERLPDDLRDTAEGQDFGSLPFSPLYRTDDEAAAEVSNQTVHGVMHLAWVDRGGGRYQGQMAVYVKPRGRLGRGYMELIKPFRHWIVYPALMRQFERAWDRRAGAAAGSAPSL